MIAYLAEAYLGGGDDRRARELAEDAAALARGQRARPYECQAQIILARALPGHRRQYWNREGFSANGTATFVLADVSSGRDVEALIRQTTEVYGRLDCACNNAGIPGAVGASTHEYPEEDWDRVISVNLKGVWLCMKHEIAQMLEQGGGAIVNTASVWGLVGAEGASAYIASKHAVVGLTRAAAVEYAQQGIRINAVNPGAIRTPILDPFIAAIPDWESMITAEHPVGRIGMPEEGPRNPAFQS